MSEATGNRIPAGGPAMAMATMAMSGSDSHTVPPRAMPGPAGHPQATGLSRVASGAASTLLSLPGLRHGIGFRLLALILLFSSVVTLLATAFQLYLDYRNDVRDIEIRIEEVRRSNLGSIAASLWRLEIGQLQLQLDGILRLPDMQALELSEIAGDGSRKVVVSAGQRLAAAPIVEEIPVHYVDRGQDRLIGMLYVEATLSGVYRRLADKALVILLSQGIKTFIVSLFILYIVHRMVTRHLTEVARFMGDFQLHQPGPPLVLDRAAPAEADEFDSMVSRFNAMCEDLRQAYDNLQEAYEELELDIVARRAAEAEVKRLNAVLEQRVRQRTAELEAANQELAAFSYSVSHDLRAPLRRIEGFSRILVDECGPALEGRGKHYLDRITNSTRDMAEMIDSFLRLSRATRGTLSIEQVDLSRQAALVLERLAEKETERQVSVDVMPGLRVDGDFRLLSVALENLLDNAWKYSRPTADVRISFGATNQDGRLVYTVRDNGTGFDMTHAAKLFVPFNRLHRTEEFEGSGIGLATVQRIIARHGGRIWAESEPGQGTAFHFTLWETEGDR